MWGCLPITSYIEAVGMNTIEANFIKQEKSNFKTHHLWMTHKKIFIKEFHIHKMIYNSSEVEVEEHEAKYCNFTKYIQVI